MTFSSELRHAERFESIGPQSGPYKATTGLARPFALRGAADRGPISRGVRHWTVFITRVAAVEIATRARLLQITNARIAVADVRAGESPHGGSTPRRACRVHVV